VIVVYTLVDGLGARAAGSGLVYVAWMLAGTAILLLALMVAVRGAIVIRVLRRNWMFALGAGGLSLASYAIALWAMTLAPIGLVAALRETSVFFAAILGTIFFRRIVRPQALAGSRTDRRRNYRASAERKLIAARLAAITAGIAECASCANPQDRDGRWTAARREILPR
jgi:drug/metabolite transporter (DMT)-like permease